MTAPAFGSVTWFQIGSEDPAATRSFYTELFDWSFEVDTNDDTEGRYAQVTTPGASHPTGGLFDTRGEVPNHAIFYVLVEDTAKTVAAAEKRGAKVLVPPKTTPAGLVFSDLLDPQGNHFGVFTPPAA
ncbi:VOC family protein [Amycolatopsis sp. cg5]|uniref:VOC family protein n=1 Tax=Amycolatopsis sp. cg5 TaxID=3238802 RepID=UPI003525C958